jgi:hypothetical protein
MIYFRNSGFGSFGFSPLAFIQSVFSRSPPIAACPSKSNGGSFLRDFGLREFRTSPPTSGVLSPRVADQAPRVLQMDGQYLLREFGFGSFSFPTPIFLRSSFSQSPQIPAACPPQIDGRHSLRSSSSTCRPPPSSEVPKYVAVISSDMWHSHQS